MNLFSGVAAVLSAAAESVICFEFGCMLPCCKWAVKMSCHNCCRLPFSIVSFLSLANWLKITDWNPLHLGISCFFKATSFPLSFPRYLFGTATVTHLHSPLEHAHSCPPVFSPSYWFSAKGCIQIELQLKTNASFWSKQGVSEARAIHIGRK